MLHNFLFPNKATELIHLRISERALNKVKEDKQELEKRIEILQASKRSFEYCKQILFDNENVLLKATYTHQGNFALITTRRSGFGPDVSVFLMPDKWEGDSVPREDCKLWYTVSDGVMTITSIESGTTSRGAGSIAMDMVLEKAEELKIKEIVGNLSNEDLSTHHDRLLGYYKKFGFDVTLYDKMPNIGGDISKKL